MAVYYEVIMRKCRVSSGEVGDISEEINNLLNLTGDVDSSLLVYLLLENRKLKNRLESLEERLK